MFLNVLLWLCLWRLDGVFGDEIKSLSVMEGNPVTLNTHLTEMQTRDLIKWTFGLEKIQIAGINKASGIFFTFDVLDGKFRDRLKLDYQTGSLTITDSRTTDSGLYIVNINANTQTTYRFSVDVKGSSPHPPSGSLVSVFLIVLISAVIVGSLLIVAVIGLCCICRKRIDNEDKTDVTLYKLTGHMMVHPAGGARRFTGFPV
ncbi:uncharacterized protein [Pseudorasbora parva]|uniref:uncharacterized protein isoform X2 n=1 Tax=Pseudorasbora parva TaxID=51549 RepID=UPI00351F50B1